MTPLLIQLDASWVLRRGLGNPLGGELARIRDAPQLVIGLPDEWEPHVDLMLWYVLSTMTTDMTLVRRADLD